MRYTILFILLFALVFNSCKRPTQKRTDFEIHGIDVSHYQKDINWDTVIQQDIHFAFVKASEGETYRDSIFDYNWAEMKRVGIRRGAYHFYTPSVPPSKQFSNFKGAVQLEKGDLPPVLDFEILGKKSKQELRAGVKKWLYLAEKHYGIRPIIYTNQKIYNSHIKEYFSDYTVWIARYNTIPPDMPLAQDWTFWQYGNRGEIKGIEGHVDFNVFKGTEDKLNEMLYIPPSSHQVDDITFL